MGAVNFVFLFVDFHFLTFLEVKHRDYFLSK